MSGLLVPDLLNQFHSPYLGMGNNPISYVDPDGRWVHIAIGAIVGGGLNLAANWGSVDNVWEGIAAFGVGAGAGAATAACGGCTVWGAAAVAVGTGAVTGATNNVIAQTGNGVGLGGVEWGSVGASAVVGGVSGVAAYGGGQLASQFGGVVVNGLSINSPVLNGLVTGAIGGPVVVQRRELPGPG